MPVEVSLSHFFENNQFFVIAFVIDISRRKEIEQAVLLQKRGTGRQCVEDRALE